MQRVDWESAYVLHRHPYRNTSWIAECLTAEHGRIAVVVRSARGPNSRFRGKVEPFQLMQLSWVGRGELKTLSQLECIAMPVNLVGDALMCGFYVNELVLRLLHRDDPHPAVFQEYHGVLSALAQAENVETVLRRFEKRLLDHLGYGLPLTRTCHTGMPISAELRYQYLPDEGFVEATPGAVAQCFHGETLMAIAAEEYPNARCLKEAKHLMRLVLARYLGGRSIKSRELLLRGGYDA